MTTHHAAPLSSHPAAHKKVLLVLDVVESVRLMEEDEGGVVQRWQQLVGHVVQRVLPPHEGRMVKSLGDGLMLEFDTAQQCVAAGFAILRYSQELNEGVSSARCMQLRLGAHVAGFVTDEHDIYGADVNLAVRLTTVTKPGEFVVSSELRAHLVEAVDGEIEDLGECFLKHISKPVRTYRIGPVRPTVRVIDENRGARTDTLQPTIAVLPFEVQSDQAHTALLGDAIADELICALSRTAQLRVISRLSTSAFKGRADVVQEIRAQLRADYLLAGICIDVGGKLVLFAELTDTKTGLVTWAERSRGDLHRLFAPDNEIFAQLSTNVCSAMMRHQLQQARTQTLPTLESYALLLGAVTLMHRLSRADFERSRSMLDALIDRLPREPLPRAWLARWHALRLSQGWSVDPREDAAHARDCINRALDSNPDCALALTIDGIVHTYLEQDHAVAAARYARALEINPNEPFAWLHSGTLHAFKGEGGVAVAQTDIALSLSPLDPMKYYFDALAATAAVSAGHYQRGLELSQRSLRANRSHTSTLRTLTISQVQLGEIDAARETMRQMLKLEPAFTVRQYRIYSPTSPYAFGEICANALSTAGAPD